MFLLTVFAFSVHLAAASAQDLPLLGIAEVEFKVSSLAKAQSFYEGVEGFKKAFEIKSSSGALVCFFKVNDDQFIAVTPTLTPGEINRFDHVGIQTSDIEKTRQMLVDRGLNPTRIEKRADGNPVFSVADPEGNTIAFLQYVAGSEQFKLRGKLNDSPRVSNHIYHVGFRIMDHDRGMDFYATKLSFDQGRTIPGPRGDYLEPSARGVDLETKDPPVPDAPATHAQYEREQYGAIFHVCLEVPNIQDAKNFLQQKGNFSDARVAPHIGHNRHWLLNIFDPDGTRTEVMEPTLQPVPQAELQTTARPLSAISRANP